MAIIVQHTLTGNYYLLLATGGGADQKLMPSRLLKNLLPAMVTVCDRQGNIFGFPATEVMVTEIDGQSPSDLLPEPEVIPPPEVAERQVTSETEVEVCDDDNNEEWI